MMTMASPPHHSGNLGRGGAARPTLTSAAFGGGGDNNLTQRYGARHLTDGEGLAYNDANFNERGAVLSRRDIRDKRSRLGFCLECEGEPVKLFDIKRSKFNPLYTTKERLTVRGKCYKGVCLRCNPEQDPDRAKTRRRRTKKTRSSGTTEENTNAAARLEAHPLPATVIEAHVEPSQQQAPAAPVSPRTPSRRRMQGEPTAVAESQRTTTVQNAAATSRRSPQTPSSSATSGRRVSSADFQIPKSGSPRAAAAAAENGVGNETNTDRRELFREIALPSLQDVVKDVETEDAPRQQQQHQASERNELGGSGTSGSSEPDEEAMETDSLERMYEISRRNSIRRTSHADPRRSSTSSQRWGSFGGAPYVPYSFRNNDEQEQEQPHRNVEQPHASESANQSAPEPPAQRQGSTRFSEDSLRTRDQLRMYDSREFYRPVDSPQQRPSNEISNNFKIPPDMLHQSAPVFSTTWEDRRPSRDGATVTFSSVPPLSTSLDSSRPAFPSPGESENRRNDSAESIWRSSDSPMSHRSHESRHASETAFESSNYRPQRSSSHDDSEGSGQAVINELDTLLKDLSGAPGNTEFIAEVILRSVRDNPMEEPILYFCLGKIWDICRDNEPNQASFMTTSAPDDILLAMKNHLSSHRLQEKGCGALWSMMSNKTENCIIMARAGAPARIVRALMEHKRNEPLVKVALGALRCMSPEPEVRDSLGALTAKKYVCQAMDLHRDVAIIQRDGCAFLNNASVDRERMEVSVATMDELDAMVKAMNAHKHDPSVMKGALFALKNYTYDENNLRMLRQCKDVHKCLEFVSTYMLGEDCCSDATEVLTRLVDSSHEDEALETMICSSLTEPPRRNSIRSDRARSVLDTMEEYSWSPKICATGMNCLQETVAEAPGNKELFSKSVIRKIIGLMDNFDTDRQIQISACGLLGSLAELEDEKLFSDLSSAGTSEKILLLLETYRDDQEVMIAAFAALLGLSHDCKSSVELEDKEASYVIEGVLEVHKDSLVLNRYAAEIIANFVAHQSAS